MTQTAAKCCCCCCCLQRTAGSSSDGTEDSDFSADLEHNEASESARRRSSTRLTRASLRLSQSSQGKHFKTVNIIHDGKYRNSCKAVISRREQQIIWDEKLSNMKKETMREGINIYTHTAYMLTFQLFQISFCSLVVHSFVVLKPSYNQISSNQFTRMRSSRKYWLYFILIGQ